MQARRLSAAAVPPAGGAAAAADHATACLRESFTYGGGGGWQSAANYAVVAPQHRPVCRNSSYPCKPHCSEDYEDVWAGNASAHVPKGVPPSYYAATGHSVLSRSKTWSPPEADSKPLDETSSISNYSDGSSSCGGSSRRGPTTAAAAGGTAGGASAKRVSHLDAGHSGTFSMDESIGSREAEPQLSPQSAPPRLAPVSGFFSSSSVTEKGVLRPVACRPTPIVRQNEYVAPPKQPPSIQVASEGKASGDEGYWSRETSRGSCAAAGSSLVSAADSRAAPRSTAIGGQPDGDAGSSGPPSPASRSPYTCASSGTASGVSPPREAAAAGRARELEQALRDREKEIENLRETLERNERAIFATFDERQASWQKQMRELSAEYQRRLCSQQERATKADASLSLQLQRAQQEVDALQEELRQCKSRADDGERRLLQRAAELEAALSRAKLDDSLPAAAPPPKISCVPDTEERLSHLKKFREDAKPASDDSRSPRGDAGGGAAGATVASRSGLLAKSLSDRDFYHGDDGSGGGTKAEVERLRAELERRNCELKALREGMDAERQLWQQEKDKVIQYQKQLQMNYVQMYRKNAQLESEVSRLLGSDAALPPPRRDCTAAGRGGVGPSVALSFADNPESLC